ncbi:DUF485 domain-containing protein [Agromyces archimandritae]|uniref:DUF485 domain-containing protein n=1 Tax=Agromyces archimandritae TaxID=2781962 RepID=A0A975FPV0_9MICO|nr:DUF485 domain-containing protein [Agromyces archimandritae]
MTAPRQRPAPVPYGPASASIGPDSSDVQGIFVRSLIRSQLRLALVFAIGFVVATALFVTGIVLVPDLGHSYLAGVPISWLLLGFGVYPLVITVGWLYVRLANRNEARYRALSEDA